MSESVERRERRFQARLNVASTAGEAAGLERFAKDLMGQAGAAFTDKDDRRAMVLREVGDMAIERAGKLRKRQRDQESAFKALAEESTP